MQSPSLRIILTFCRLHPWKPPLMLTHSTGCIYNTLQSIIASFCDGNRNAGRSISSLDIPVFPTDRGWQPVQISSWWWCICWNETPSPAPASGGLCKLPCISPSFLFCLRSWQETRHTALRLFSSQVVELEASHRGEPACQDRPICTEHLY